MAEPYIEEDLGFATMRDAWDPEQYRLFREQRLQPLHDLLDLVDPRGVERAVDLGCGPGEMTELVARRVPLATVVGVDNSPTMLERARTFTTPQIRFVEGDLAHWSDPVGVDLIVANASLHWAPSHSDVLALWSASLRPGGQLAVQVPSNADQPQHRIAIDLATEEPYASVWGPSGPPPDVVVAHVLTPNRYAQILDGLGFVDIDVTVKVYPHRLPSTRHVVEWVKGTTLTRFRTRLPDNLYQQFVAEYERRLLNELGDSAPYFFPFSRVFLHARRPECDVP